MIKIIKKKATVLILLFSTVSFSTVVQSISIPDQMKLKVISSPQNVDGLSLSQISKIETKIYKLVSNYDMSAIDHVDNFVIYPKYEIYEEDKVTTQIKIVYTIKAELTLLIQEAKSKGVIASYSQRLVGEGDTRDIAINKSIARFQTKNSKIEQFVARAKEKILAYNIPVVRKTTIKCPKTIHDADWLCKNHKINCH